MKRKFILTDMKIVIIAANATSPQLIPNQITNGFHRHFDLTQVLITVKRKRGYRERRHVRTVSVELGGGDFIELGYLTKINNKK